MGRCFYPIETVTRFETKPSGSEGWVEQSCPRLSAVLLQAPPFNAATVLTFNPNGFLRSRFGLELGCARLFLLATLDRLLHELDSEAKFVGFHACLFGQPHNLLMDPFLEKSPQIGFILCSLIWHNWPWLRIAILRAGMYLGHKAGLGQAFLLTFCVAGKLAKVAATPKPRASAR